MQRMILLCCLLVAMSTAWCRTVVLPAAFDEKSYPAQITLGELTADWFKVNTPAVESVDSTLMLGMMVHGRPWVQSDITLTRGQLVSLSRRLYLVVYRLESKIAFTDDDLQALAPLTPQTLLYPSLVSMSDLMALNYAGPFNLEQAIRERAKAIEEHAREIEERAREEREQAEREEDMADGEEQGNNEAMLKAALRQMRAAIARFKADTGAYPAALTDLVLPPEKAPANGVDANGKPVAIAAGTYAGPYLRPQHGLAEAPGIPLNPYVKLHRDDPATTMVANHWQYKDGYVGVPEYLFGILSSDGKMLGEL